MTGFRTLLLPLSLAVCVVALISCDAPPGHSSGKGDYPRSASLETHPGLLRKLQTIPHEAVRNTTGPNGTEFFVKTRDQEIRQAPCSACHADMPELYSREGLADQQTMHLDIALDHATAETMNCQTCHDTQDPQTLNLLNGQEVDINHSYQVCAQCHFEQHKDWAGGAHGKRLAGWQGRRVIDNCTDCHNPHAPAFPIRLPDLGPRFPDTGGHHE